MLRLFSVFFLLLIQVAYSQCYKIDGRVARSTNTQLAVTSNGNVYGVTYYPPENGLKYARGLRVSMRVFYDKKSNTYVTRESLIDLPLRGTASKVSSVEPLDGLRDMKSCLKVTK